MTVSFVRRLRALVLEMGVRSAIAYRLDKILHEAGIGRLISYGIFAQPVKVGPPTGRRSSSRPGKVEYRVVERTDPMLEGLGLGDALQFRNDQGATCVGAIKEGRLIGAIWFIEGQYQEDEVRCRFLPEPKDIVVWDFGVHVDPEYRMSPVFARLWATTSRIMAENGAKWSCSRISAYNPQSVRSHQRLGAKCVGNVRFLNLFGLQVMWGHIPPYFHLSLPGRWGPILHIRPGTD